MQINGDMGTQIFQIVFGYIIAYIIGGNLVLDIPISEPEQHKSLLNLIDINRLNIKIFDSKQYTNLFEINESIFGHSHAILNNVCDTINKNRSHDNFYLIGSWKKINYTDMHEKNIKIFFDLNNIKHKHHELCHEINGDDKSYVLYVGTKNNDMQNIVPYIIVNYLLNEDINYYIFTDDVDKCKIPFNRAQNFINIKNIKFIEESDDLVNIYMISKSKNNIILNDPINWWGAWLNDNIHKNVVYAPYKIQNNLVFNYPRTWTSIEMHIKIISDYLNEYEKVSNTPFIHLNKYATQSKYKVLIPYYNRYENLIPVIKCFGKMQNNNSQIVVIENSPEPTLKEACILYNFEYIWFKLEIKKFNKCLCFNLGFIYSTVADYYLCHDTDMIFESTFWKNIDDNLSFYKTEYLRAYNHRSPYYMSSQQSTYIRNDIDKIIFFNEMLLQYTNPEHLSSNLAVSPGGSILVSRNLYLKVGGFDDMFFYGYSPEDTFFQNKCSHVTTIQLHADKPNINTYHLYHTPAYNINGYIDNGLGKICGLIFPYIGRYIKMQQHIFLQRIIHNATNEKVELNLSPNSFSKITIIPAPLNAPNSLIQSVDNLKSATNESSSPQISKINLNKKNSYNNKIKIKINGRNK